MTTVEQPLLNSIDDMAIESFNSHRKVVFYNLSGQPVVNPQRGGCYIVRMTDEQGNTKTVKLMKK